MRAISGTRTIAPRPRARACLDGAQVDLGLARAGHPVQQQRPAVAHRGDDRGQGIGLVGGEDRRLVGRRSEAADRLEGACPTGARASRAMTPSAAIRRSVGIVVAAARHSSAAAMLPPASARAAATARRRGLPGSGAPAGQRGRQPGRRARGRRRQDPLAAPAAPKGAVRPGRQDQLQAGGDRRDVVARDPEGELEQVARNGRRVDDAREGREPALVGRRAAAGDDAEHATSVRAGRPRAPPAPPPRRAPPAPRSRASGRGPAPRPAGRPGPRRPAPQPPGAAR